MTKMLSALPPDPRYRLVLRTRHGAPPTTDPFRRLWSREVASEDGCSCWLDGAELTSSADGVTVALHCADAAATVP